MRILTVGNRYPPWSLGGYEVVWSAAVAWLREAGHSVRVLTTRPDPSDSSPAGPPPPEVYRELRWYWRNHAFPGVSLGAAAALERENAATLRRHLLQFDPDAVNWWAMGGMSLGLIELVRRAALPAVGSVGDEWMGYGPQVDAWMRRWTGATRPLAGFAERIAGVPARLNLERGTAWLFTSGYLLERARAAGWSLPGARVLPHGIDAARFGARPAPPWSWRLLYCGRIDPRKGIDTAIQALAALPQQTTLTIHGSGQQTHLQELIALAQRLGVADRVRFQSSAHLDVPEVYAGADVVVFPVRWREPWGLVPLEAMAVGRPVVATRAGGGPDEYLQEDVNCLRFAVGDAAGLAAAIHRLATAPELRARLLDAGRHTAARFSDQAFHVGLERTLLDLRR